jgi:hypothetical protein
LEKVIQEYQQEMIAYAFRKVDRQVLDWPLAPRITALLDQDGQPARPLRSDYRH